MLEDTRRMLLSQDFGLEIARFEPGAVKTLYNTHMNGLAMAVFAQEWHTAFMVSPESTAATDPDWLRTGLGYQLAANPTATVASDVITLSL